jgi:hypothetical protein
MNKVISIMLLSAVVMLSPRLSRAESGLDVITVTEIQAQAIAGAVDDTSIILAGAFGAALYYAMFDLPGIFPAGRIPDAFSLLAKTTKTTLWLGGLTGPGQFPADISQAALLSVQGLKTLSDATNLQDDLQVFFGYPDISPLCDLTKSCFTRVLPRASEDADAFIPSTGSAISTFLTATVPSEKGLLLRLVEYDIGGLFGSDSDELGTALIRGFAGLRNNTLYILNQDEGSVYRVRFRYEKDEGKWADLHPIYRATMPEPSIVTARKLSAYGTVEPLAPLTRSNLVQLVTDSTVATYSIIPDRGYRSAIESTCGGNISEFYSSRYDYRTDPVTKDCEIDVTFTLMDRDGDGVGDLDDRFPDDPTETQDSDGDGIGDNTDEFTSAVTTKTVSVPVSITGGPSDLTLTTLPGAKASTCSLSTVSADPVPNVYMSRAIAQTQMAFTLSGCGDGEEIQVTLDFGVALPADATAYKLLGTKLTRIPGARVSGSTVSYTLTDNGPLDTDDTPGVIADPVVIFFAPLSVPIMPVWLLVAMGAMLSLIGIRGLQVR